MSAAPRVSVVIPTRNRPRLVRRAVESALAQTIADIEVLVVVDGPDRPTTDALAEIPDPRLRVVPRARSGGGGAARNTGVREAAARWIAFLDDDDAWRPEKLAVQLRVAEDSAFAQPIVAARIEAVDGNGRSRVWPRRLPAPGEPLGDYLLARRTPFWGEALVHPSTLLVGRALLLEAPFREDLPVHEDLEWLLRASRVEGAGLEFPPSAEPLATWSVDPGRRRQSRDEDWRASLSWAHRARPLLSRRAYSAFLLTWVGAHAARLRDVEGLWRLPLEAFRGGRPRPRDLLLFAGFWVLPESFRTWLGGRLTGRR